LIVQTSHRVAHRSNAIVDPFGHGQKVDVHPHVLAVPAEIRGRARALPIQVADRHANATVTCASQAASTLPPVKALGALVAAAAALAVPAAAATYPARSLHVVSLDDFRIGARAFLGRTPTQITSAFGRPDARTTRVIHGKVVTVQLRYATWTISFKRRAGDGKLLASAARTTDPLLTGRRGTRLLAPWFGTRGIQGAVVREVGGVDHPEGNEWILRSDHLDNANVPRTVTWGVAGHTRWLSLATDLNVEFAAPLSR
jgi:hypothetical protein